MFLNNKILVGKSGDKELSILLDKANRHGVISGASGSGKTITLKVMAESFSDAGVPCFVADVKGDLAGTAIAGEENEKLDERLNKLGLNDFEYKSFPVRFWDIFGMAGHPIRTTIDQVGPEILSMMLGLNEAQEGILNIVFKIAKDNDLKLDDLKDLRLLLQYVGDNRDEYTTKYGNVSTASVGVIQRCLITLENQGADKFFGHPSLEFSDLLNTDVDGRGYINILHCVELFKSPDLYASFLLWLLNNFYHNMPEVGDTDKPKLVFFFDEAHLLFNNLPEYRLKRIIQSVKLMRSHGIGLYFISQSITDVPNDILAQLGNRVQHTLRAYTPSEQKNVKAAADSFRTNENFDTERTILELGTGEALISFQNEKGEPEIVEKATILPPQSMMGTIDDTTRNRIINNSNLVGKYEEIIERDSAYEELDKLIKEKIEREEEEKRKEKEEKEKSKAEEKEKREKEKAEEKAKKEAEKEQDKKSKKIEKLGDRLIGNAASAVERKILNSILKKLF
jgi:DNA helicase HerA-like ATPase